MKKSKLTILFITTFAMVSTMSSSGFATNNSIDSDNRFENALDQVI